MGTDRPPRPSLARHPRACPRYDEQEGAGIRAERLENTRFSRYLSSSTTMEAPMTRSGKIRCGIGGWTFEPWRGVFYPSGLSQKKELEYASRHLTAIEI